MNWEEPSTKAERKAVLKALEAGQRRNLRTLRTQTYIAQEVGLERAKGLSAAAAATAVAKKENMTAPMVSKRVQEFRRSRGLLKHPPGLTRKRRSKN
jgi:hypothetical protein